MKETASRLRLQAAVLSSLRRVSLLVAVVGIIMLLQSPALAQTSTPSAPTNVIAAHEGATRIHIGWDHPASDGGSAVTHYLLQWSTDNSTWSTLQAIITGTHYTHTGLSEGDTRYYRVYANNTNGLSTFSTVVNTTTAGVNVALHGPEVTSPTCDGNTTVTIVDNTNDLQDIVISLEWQIEGVVQNVQWFLEKYRSGSYLGSEEGQQTGTGT